MKSTWLLLTVVFFINNEGLFAQINKFSSGQQIQRFYDENPLFSVDICTAELAVRYRKGKGIPIVFVHGSWDDHHSWGAVAASLTAKVGNPIVLYDRRGHSASTPDYGQGSISEDVEDIVLLMQALGFKKAHFIGHSYGSNVVVQLVSGYPAIAESVVLYEPPLFGILKGKIEYKEELRHVKKEMLFSKSLLERGEIEKGTIHFIEKVAFGDNSWKGIFDERARCTMLLNYRTWLDQSYDTERLNIDLQKLNDYEGKLTLVYGSSTLSVYKSVVAEMDKILQKKSIVSIENAGHGGLCSHFNETALCIFDHLKKEMIQTKSKMQYFSVCGKKD